MTHALRRVSFSTCLPNLFAFAARDPGQPLNKQFCHVFRTSQVRTHTYTHPHRHWDTDTDQTKPQKVASLTRFTLSELIVI